MATGRNNSETSSGSSGHAGDTRPGQTRKKPKDLSAREREERVCGVCMLCTFVFIRSEVRACVECCLIHKSRGKDKTHE